MQPKVKNKTDMEATIRKKRTILPISHYWGLVKDLDDSQKKELAIMIIDSIKLATAKKQEAEDEDHSIKPYTIEEIHAMIDQSERDIAEGRIYDFDDAMDDLEKEFAEEDRKLEMAETI